MKLDNLKEALEYDKYGMVSRARTDRNIESFISFSSRRQKCNSIKVKVIGKRKREFGLVIPAAFIAHTENKRAAEISDTELAKRRKMFTTFELKYKPKRLFRAFPVFDLKL